MKRLLLLFLALTFCRSAKADIYHHQLAELSPDVRAAFIASTMVCIEQSDWYAGLQKRGSWTTNDGRQVNIKEFRDRLEKAAASDHSLTVNEYRVIINHPAWQPWFDRYVVRKHGCNKGITTLKQLPAKERSEMAIFGPAFMMSAASMAAKCAIEIGYTEKQSFQFAWESESSDMQEKLGVSLRKVYKWSHIDAYNDIRKTKHKKYDIGFNRFIFRNYYDCGGDFRDIIHEYMKGTSSPSPSSSAPALLS